MLTFFLFWICGISYVGASHFVVTAPNVLRFDHKETILVSIFDEVEFKVKTWLQIDGRKFSNETVTVLNEETPKPSSIRVTEADLFDDGKEKEDIPRYVTLYAETTLGTYSRKIPLSYDTGYILVQTSKPLYHPKDKVNVRVLGMTESLRFAKGWNISMDLMSPSGITFGRYVKEKGTDRFFEESMTLPPQAELGLWTVKAYYKGQYKTQGKAHFKVQEYVLPTFGVTVDVDKKVILPDTEKVKITVTAKYVYNKPVKGKAVLKISCLDDDKNLISLEDQPHIKLDNTGEGEYTVDVEDIIDAAGRFPDGQRLQISARAIEQVTLNEEIGAYENTLFSRNRFKLDFEKSKKIYHPGFSYYLRVTVSLANGDFPDVQTIRVVAKVNNNVKDEQRKKSDRKGETLVVFPTSNQEDAPLDFEVSINGEPARVFTVHPYKSKAQLQIDHFVKNNKLMLDIATNIQVDSASGIICLMLSRGKYIHHEYSEPSNEIATEISEDIQDKIAPVARLVGFYINKADGKLVADSSSMSLTPKCHGEKLTLIPELSQPGHEFPGAVSTLDIRGVPNMYVGLNVMDEALLLLDDDHVLRKSKIFDMMRSHDLGCGEGGGRNAEEVFRDAGLTVVTNANVDADILEGNAMQCEGHSRKKRSLDCSSTSSVECCEVGESYANEEIMKYEKDDYQLEVEADDICKVQSLFLSTLRNEDGTNRYSFLCLSSHYYKCVETILDYVKGNQIFGNSALDTSSDFLDALVNYEIEYSSIKVRSDFKDSWLFQTVRLNEQGRLGIKQDLFYPSSITDWMFQGIGISDTHGPCIAEPVNVTVIQDFFIQLELPYKATRLEYFEITATVFNYNTKNSIKTDVFIEGVRGLCTGVDPGKHHLIATFDLQKSDAQTVRIPILPLEARDSFNIKVTAFGKLGGQSLSDAVEKKLLVVNEGIEERETIQVCLDPMNTDDDNPKCLKNPRVESRVVDDYQITEVDLTLPDRALIETGSAFAYLSSNVMDEPVREMISGIGNMLRKPRGCGEQTMIYLGPTVYVKMYWEQTNQMNQDREQQANTWIREGVARELTYRKSDGSYAAWLGRPSSTWLTAFVAKVFCQAERIVDNAVKPAQDIVPTIKWLAKMVREPEGNFYDPKPVIHREMIGQIKENDPSLTAFVLITLSECKHRSGNTDLVRLRAMQYLESLSERDYKRNPYLLAITTYALSMAKSPESRRFMRMLLANDNAVTIRSRREKDRHRNRLGRFWGNPGGHPANANSVETTAYALLAMLKHHRIREAANVVKWLIGQRNAEGAFRTTQDTIIGLQALSQYTAATYTTDVDLSIKLSSEGWEEKSLTLSKENIDLQEIVKGLPVSREKTILVVKTKGRGTGRLVIDYRYNRKATEQEKCSFEISAIEIEELNIDIDIGNQNFNRDCDVCGKCTGDNEGNKDNVILDDPDVHEIPAMQAHIAKRAAGNENKPPKKHCIRFSVGSLGTNDHGMSIIDIGLETGMTVVKADLDKLKTDGVIDSYEMPTQKKGFVILYIDKIVKEPVKIIFRLKDNFEGDSSSRQPAAIKIYDYYHPEKECTKFYGSGLHTGSPVKFECQEDGETNKKACTCLQNVCPDPQESDKIIQKGKAKEKPVQQLVELVCDNQRANFAARVKVLRIDFDEDKGTQTVQVEVEKRLHKGKDVLSSGDELELEMRIFCNIEIKERQMYYLITKDGVGEDPVKYHLSGNSVMVEYNDKGKMTKEEKLEFRKSDRNYLQQIMDVFERQIAKGCPG